MTEVSSTPAIQEVFGQFAVELEDGVKLFPSQAEAATALAAFEDGAENLQLAQAYAAGQGLDGKNAKGKVNVVVSFLNWVSAGSPEFVPPVVKEEVVIVGEDDAPVTF
jgi:hypothetical protein